MSSQKIWNLFELKDWEKFDNYPIDFRWYCDLIDEDSRYKIHDDTIIYTENLHLYAPKLRNITKPKYRFLAVVNTQRLLGLHQLGKRDEFEDGLKALRKLAQNGILFNTFINPTYKLSNWPSGMAQGQYLSCLLRSKPVDEEYCKIVYNSLFKETSLNGVFNSVSQYFEEYPTTPHSSVLNGHLYSLIGIIEYELKIKHALTKKTENILTSTLNSLNKYLATDGHFYDAWENPANESYQKLHVLQLKIISKLIYADEKSSTFTYYSNKFEQRIGKLNERKTSNISIKVAKLYYLLKGVYHENK